MKKLRLLSSALCVTALTLSFAGCDNAFAGDRYHEEVHTHVAMAPATLRIDDPVGKVTVLAWNRPAVQIDAVKRAGSVDAVHAITISVEPDGNVLNVNAEFGGTSSSRSVDFTIHAPASSALNIEANVGEVDATGFLSNVDVQADVGKVALTMARLGRGQHVTITSSVGSVDLTVPHDASAKVTASTSVGSIDGNIPFVNDRHTVGEDGSATIGRGEASVHLTASTGSIHVNRE
jgi:hypothetical protein